MKSSQSILNSRDENGTINPSQKRSIEESVVNELSRVYSGPIVDVDNDEHQSMQIEEKKSGKGM